MHHKTLAKNPGFSVLYEKKSQILNESHLKDCTIRLENLPQYEHAPVTTCDIKQFFLHYQNIESDRRQNFASENLEKYFVHTNLN